MQLLYRILRAVHANGTHHKLALDSLAHLTGDNHEDWQRLFLHNAELFMEGAKAPDKEFKDFRNHVLHVRDNLWGGAPAKARSWYGHLVEALENRDWPMAAYCAGVLSHYYTDPIMPLHTAQSDAESSIHRAVEWSISKSYDDLVADALRTRTTCDIKLGDDPNWLADLVVAGAYKSNAHYEQLITHYNIDLGVTDPPAGLDKVARRTIGELLVYASRGFALIMERAITEAGVEPDKVSLNVTTVLAGLTIPIRWVTNKIADKNEAALVRAMYDELQATGTVEVNLPEDDRAIRDLYKAEVSAKKRRSKTNDFFAMPQPNSTSEATPKRLPNTKIKPGAETGATTSVGTQTQPLSDQAALAGAAPQPISGQGPTITTAPASLASALSQAVEQEKSDALAAQRSTPARGIKPASLGSAPPRKSNPAKAHKPVKAVTVDASLMASLSRLQPRVPERTASPDNETASTSALTPMPGTSVQSSANGPTPLPMRPAAPTGPAPRQSHAGARGERFYLSIGDDIVDAPSIGKKTAARLQDAGLYSVEDLLTCDPVDVSRQVDVRHITPDTLTDWQDQARLVCIVPELRGTHAQILVGAGYRDPDAIAQAEQGDLLSAILRFAGTSDGQRVLRNGQPPDIEKVLFWIAQAARAELARAA